jgi:hypothetical protein
MPEVSRLEPLVRDPCEGLAFESLHSVARRFGEPMDLTVLSLAEHNP